MPANSSGPYNPATMAKRATRQDRFPLLDYIDKQMARVHENVAAAMETFEESAIHDTRVATRRMKAALDLLQPVLSKQHRKPLSRGLKKLRQHLGPLRDADVMIQHLAKLVEDRRHGAAAHWLGQQVEASRESLRKTSREDGSVEKTLRRLADWPLVRSEIGDAREAVDCLLAESLHLQTDAFAEQADRLVRQLADAPTPAREGDAASTATRQNPHDLRIAGKALRYTLEMAEAQRRSPGARVMSTFKRMQEQLGNWHDLVVLADSVLHQTIGSEVIHHDPARSGELLDLAKHAVTRSALELRGFCRLWSQKGLTITAQIRSAFPLTQSAGPADAASSDVETTRDADPGGDVAAENADLPPAGGTINRVTGS